VPLVNVPDGEDGDRDTPPARGFLDVDNSFVATYF
jgi:hypothetical protein